MVYRPDAVARHTPPAGSVKIGDARRTNALSNFVDKKGICKECAGPLENGIFQLACRAKQDSTTYNMDKGEYKEYVANFKRICTFLGRNPNLLNRLKDPTDAGFAQKVAGMKNEDLETVEMRQQKRQWEEVGMME